MSKGFTKQEADEINSRPVSEQTMKTRKMFASSPTLTRLMKEVQAQ